MVEEKGEVSGLKRETDAAFTHTGTSLVFRLFPGIKIKTD